MAESTNMPCQQDASSFEQTAAIRRGTRNRIAKRRPDFVDPFSLRKKRKLKNEADELLSALSPCSEEGSLKLDSSHNLPISEGKESNSFSSIKIDHFDSEGVQSIPTSNPKVKVIIRLSSETNMESLKKSVATEPVVKLRLRLRPATPNSKPQTNGSALSVSPSNPEVEYQGATAKLEQMSNGPQRDLQVTRSRNLTKAKAQTTLGSHDNDMASKKAQRCPNLKKKKVSLISRDDTESDDIPRKLEDVSYREKLLTPPTSHQNDLGHKIHTKHRSLLSRQEHLLLNKKGEGFVPKEDPLSMVGVRKKKPGAGKAHTPQGISAGKVNLRLVLRVSSLPIRKRPYMREVKASPLPALRRSTRNRQHPSKSV